MRKYGEISGVYFVSQGWDIYNLATKYKLSVEGEVAIVYVNTMPELQEEITNMKLEVYNQSKIEQRL